MALRRARSLGLTIVGVGVLAAGCGVRDRLKQVETMSNMGSVVIEIKQAREKKGEPLTDQEVRALIEASPRGHDAWGHPLLYFSKGQGTALAWVLISPGRDGRLDLDPTDKYFELQPEEIRGRPARDIVFRNGEVVTNAGN